MTTPPPTPASSSRSPMDGATWAKIALGAAVVGLAASWIGGPGIVVSAIGLILAIYVLRLTRGGFPGDKQARIAAAIAVAGIISSALFQALLWNSPQMTNIPAP